MLTENEGKFKMAEPKHVIDVKNLPSLKGASRERDSDYEFLEKLKLTSINHSKRIEQNDSDQKEGSQFII